MRSFLLTAAVLLSLNTMGSQAQAQQAKHDRLRVSERVRPQLPPVRAQVPAALSLAANPLRLFDTNDGPLLIHTSHPLLHSSHPHLSSTPLIHTSYSHLSFTPTYSHLIRWTFVSL